MSNNLFRIRVTGVLIENDMILLVKQKVSSRREWSLPGGKLECGESIEDGVIRELFEETGIRVETVKLLYLSELPETNPPVIHITFLLKRISGDITKPTNEFETTPIHDVKFVPIHSIQDYGFSEKFMGLVKDQFPHSGSYMGHKREIGLDH